MGGSTFVNALAKRKQEKMPEKLVELIDDDRNNNSDTLLRKTAVEIEPSLATSKIKQYVDKVINDRYRQTSQSIYYSGQLNASLRKAMLWDVKGSFTEPLNLAIQQYEKLEVMENKKRDIEQTIESEREAVQSYEKAIKNAQTDINDFYSGNPYNFEVKLCLEVGIVAAYAERGVNPRAYCLKSLEERLQKNKTGLNTSKVKLERAITELKNIKKTFVVEVEETHLVEERLNAALKE